MKCLHPFKRIFVIFFLMFIVSHNLFAETEPNNDVASANLMKVNETMTGSLSNSDEFDYYKIVITEDGRLSIMDNTSSNLDYYIRLFDADGSTIIKSVLRYKDNTGTRIAVNLFPGTYYIQTDRWGLSSSGEYTIYPQFEPTTYPGDTEVNDSPEGAVPLTLNKTNTGNLGNRRDGIYDEFDYWKITITEDGRLTLLDSTESNLDYHIRLFDADGTTQIRTELRYKDNSGSRIGVNLSPGTYYVQLDMWGLPYSTYGSYTIYPRFIPATYPGDTEVNDSVEVAATLELNKTNSGNLGNRRDGMYDEFDYWKLIITEDGRLTLQDTTESHLDYYIRLFDADGTTQIRTELRYKDNSGARIGVNLSPGTYYVQLDMWGLPYSTYGSYTIYPQFVPVTYPGDAEVNDSVEVAATLELNKTNTGNLGSRRDGMYDEFDYWKLIITEDGRLTLQDTTESHLDYYIRLFDADGATLIRHELRYKDNSGLRIGVNLSPGTYYVQLDMWGLPYSTYGSYTIYPRFIPATYPGDAEVNDSVKVAATLELNKTNTGNLGNRRDGMYDEFDYWKITITEDGRLTLLDSTESNLDYHIRLFDANGTTLVRSELRYKDNTGRRIGINLSPGTYYVQLDMWGLPYSTYGSYTIYPQFVPVTYPGDPEPNDSMQVAGAISLDTIVSGNLGSRRDGDYDEVDWWKFSLTEGGLLSLNDSTESHLDYYLKLYESDGTTLIRSVLRYKDNSGSRISEKLSEGTYYLLLDKWGVDYSTYDSYIIYPGFLPKPKADFKISQNITSFSFTNQTIDGENYTWDFDDGESSDQVNPAHTFSEPGEYLVSLIAENTAGSDTATQIIVIYGVSDVMPKEIGNSGEVTLTILGGGFSEDVTVMLRKEGAEDLVATRVEYFERGAVRATFNMTGTALGEWDISVNNPGNEPIVEEKALTIVAATEPEPWVNLSGRSRALFNRWQTYTLEYGNTGNVDADVVPVWITLSDPENNQLEFLDMEVLYPDYAVDNNQEARLDSITWYFDLDTLWGRIEPTRVYPLYIPKIPAGYTGNIKFRIKTGTQVRINVWNNPPLMENGTLKSLCLGGPTTLAECIEQVKNRAIRDLALTYAALILPPGGGCVTSLAKEFFAIRDMRMENYSKRRSWGSFTYAMTSLFLGCVGDIVGIGKIYELAIAITGTIQFLHDGIYQADKDCHEKFDIKSHRDRNIRGVNSFDPNEIIGPAGYGAGNYIRPPGTAVYTIFFENKDTASAPAQEIWISDTLDLSKFKLDEFSFQTLTIGDTTVNLMFGQKEFSVDIDFRPSKQLIGRAIGKLDTVNGVVSVYLSSLDPVSMQQNEDPDLGILPPNVNSPEGEGSVSFSVGVFDLVNGESFENKAMITFDFNEPIFTNTWMNIIDDQAPVSKIETFSYDQANNEILLNLSGSDNLAGIDYYMIFASINDSSYAPVLRTSDNSVAYKVTAGWDYKFYSVAADSIGNMEEAPGTEDIEVMVSGIFNRDKVQNEYHIYPNPATRVLYLETETPGNRFIELITIDGRVIRKKQMNSSREIINISGLDKGLYMIRISGNNFNEMQKIIIE